MCAVPCACARLKCKATRTLTFVSWAFTLFLCNFGSCSFDKMLERPGWAIFTVLLKINANNFNFFDTIYIAVVVVFFALFLSRLLVHAFIGLHFGCSSNGSMPALGFVGFALICPPTHLPSSSAPPPPLHLFVMLCRVFFSRFADNHHLNTH